MATYQASFQNLEVMVKGIYTLYNLTPDEITSLRKTFPNDITRNNNNSYTVTNVIEHHLWLNLFIHELWIPIRFDIKNEYLKLANSISKEDIARISKSLQDLNINIIVSYNPFKDEWSIKDFNCFLEVLKNLM